MIPLIVHGPTIDHRPHVAVLSCARNLPWPCRWAFLPLEQAIKKPRRPLPQPPGLIESKWAIRTTARCADSDRQRMPVPSRSDQGFLCKYRAFM